MNEDVSKIKLLVDKINAIGFFQRLFGWRKFTSELIDISSSLANITNELQSLRAKKEELNATVFNYSKDLSVLQKEIERLQISESKLDQFVQAKDLEINRLAREFTAEKSNRANLEEQLRNINKDLGVYKERTEGAEAQLKTVTEENIQLKKDEQFRTRKYEDNVAALNSLREQIQKERQDETEQKHQEEVRRIDALKQTWQHHQAEVQNRIKALCSKHTIQYVDKVPFKGEPDNTLYICDEHVIFDAKSPSGEELSNFPAYVKDQAEKAKKYARQESVKTDIFFVVPSNTLHALKQFVFNMADYNVYIISLDVLEPLILALCKIEEYEFAEQLSPEDRENICRILGKFAHLSKRRIQIDSFFAKQFIELAYKCENTLPADIHDKVLEFERSEKLNPPVEKRAKAISLKELETDLSKLNKEAEAKGIVISNDISVALDDVDLYK